MKKSFDKILKEGTKQIISNVKVIASRSNSDISDDSRSDFSNRERLYSSGSMKAFDREREYSENS
jgi:hypothetical protein